MEQFFFVPLIPASFFLSFSNNFVYLFVSFFILVSILIVLSFESGSLKGFVFVQNAGLLSVASGFFGIIKDISVSMLGPEKGLRLYPFFSALFFSIFTLNFIGIIPYSYTVTSQLSSVFSLSCSLLVGNEFLMFKRYGKRTFSYFLPSGTPLSMVLFIVPLEVGSYLVRFISLPVRLFANMMSGHILLKVFVGLASSLFAVKSVVSFFASFVPLLVLILLLFLEIGVALVQAYVFILLILIFLSDSYDLH
jgi:F-type H+-transporting ATPase subunit a